MLKSLKSDIINKKKTIAVYGLGNVGGPIAAAWLRAGSKVIGVDISHELISQIKLGISHKKEPYVSEIFTTALRKKHLILTMDGIYASKQSDIKIVAVPVAFKKKKVDLHALISATTDISYGLKKGDAVLISPSLTPGTTEEIVLPILEQNSKLIGERDFYLIYNPERIFEGRALQDIELNYPAIVAGLGSKSLVFGSKLLRIISKKGVLTMSTIASAETEKLFEGVYRDVNVALANELANFCEGIGVNYWEVRKGSNSQPFCHLHYPGTGVGGLCIPVYPQFVIAKAKRMRTSLKIVENARKLNDYVPKKCVNDAISMLKNSDHKKINAVKVAVLGLGFRGEVADSRLSPTYTVVNEFLNNRYEVAVHDPFILKDTTLPHDVMLSSNMNSVLDGADLVFISTDHKMYSSLTNKNFVKTKKPLLIYDGRNILNRHKIRDARILTIGIR